jgi:hypothetical protein
LTSDQHLARIVESLHENGIDVLVMGGHAVRYYGVSRNTVDFDLVTSVVSPDLLRTKLASIQTLSHALPEPVWRSRDFARFEVGRLADGRSEYLEFWLRNHLLDDFSKLKGRAEVGMYGGKEMRFLSLGDLIRSKETERESDWADISLLEEIQDGRLLAAYQRGAAALPAVLSQLRSRRGMDEAIGRRLLVDSSVVDQAIAAVDNFVTFAFLLPFASKPQSPFAHVAAPWMTALLAAKAGTPRHSVMIEVARRAYRRQAVETDRADKQQQLDRERTV